MHLRLAQFFAIASFCFAQDSITHRVQGVSVRLIATNERAAAIPFETITAAWRAKGIRVAVENPFSPSELIPAATVIRQLYSEVGRKVRVEHAVVLARPHNVEISFQVVELCDSN